MSRNRHGVHVHYWRSIDGTLAFHSDLNYWPRSEDETPMFACLTYASLPMQLDRQSVEGNGTCAEGS
jgi:hypothetical protein